MMTTALKLLCRVIQRRMEKGEELEAVLRDYPRLSGEEREAVRSALHRQRA